MKKELMPLVLMVLVAVFNGSASAQTIINCPGGFNNSGGACAVGGTSAQIYLANAAIGGLTGRSVAVVQGGTHSEGNMLVVTPANIQAFTTTFTFHLNCAAFPGACANGFGFTIIAANSSNPKYPPGFTFNADSQSNLGWSQCLCASPPNNNNCGVTVDEAIVKFDMFAAGPGGYGHNLTNYYQASTSLGPVCPQFGRSGGAASADFDMSANGINMQSDDEFTVTLTYDGSNLFETITDNSHPSDTFSTTYTGINLPSIFGANTAFIGFSASTNTGGGNQYMYVDSWTYTVNSPGPKRSIVQ